MRRLDPHDARPASARGMTLIELITVMALLSIALAFSAPKLSHFFRARGLKEEARRTLALTRYARSEAISRGMPMEVWFNVETGAYGVRPQVGFEFDDGKDPMEYEIGDEMAFEIDPEFVGAEGDATILVGADGEFDEESPQEVLIRDENERLLGIKQEDFGLGYALVKGEPGQ